jgi:DNA-binding MarR family transcriptional regulator
VGAAVEQRNGGAILLPPIEHHRLVEQAAGKQRFGLKLVRQRADMPGVLEEFSHWGGLSVVGKPHALRQATRMEGGGDGGDRNGEGQELTLPHLVKWVEMAVRARTERAMRGMPVSGSQLLALVLVEERGEATAAEVARMMRITPQAMTTLVKPLLAQAYLDRRSDEAHGRRLLLRLTPQGRTILQEARRVAPAIEAEVLGDFTEAEKTTLKRLLSRIAKQLD